MSKNIFLELTNEQLFQIVEELDADSIPDNSLSRKVTQEFYKTETPTLIQFVTIGMPIAIELSKRLKECQLSLI